MPDAQISCVMTGGAVHLSMEGMVSRSITDGRIVAIGAGGCSAMCAMTTRAGPSGMGGRLFLFFADMESVLSFVTASTQVIFVLYRFIGADSLVPIGNVDAIGIANRNVANLTGDVMPLVLRYLYAGAQGRPGGARNALAGSAVQ